MLIIRRKAEFIECCQCQISLQDYWVQKGNVFGMSLHMEQDQFAHVTTSHTAHSDDPDYNYSEENGWQLVKEGDTESRIKNTEEATCESIQNFLDTNGSELFQSYEYYEKEKNKNKNKDKNKAK